MEQIFTAVFPRKTSNRAPSRGQNFGEFFSTFLDMCIIIINDFLTHWSAYPCNAFGTAHPSHNIFEIPPPIVPSYDPDGPGRILYLK